MKARLAKFCVAAVVALLLLVALAQSAFAGISFCDDLAPMASVAVGNNNTHAAKAEALTPTVDAHAVSTSIGGLNPHK